MRFTQFYAQFKRQSRESTAWKLLSANNSALILAFINDIFIENHEVLYESARMSLHNILRELRENGEIEGETNADTYLRSWIRDGYLREIDGNVLKTDASDTALRFCQSLEDRGVRTTASHLRIVQDTIRDFTYSINPNVEERLAVVRNKREMLDKEIEALERGEVPVLTDLQLRERVREIYHQASTLNQDFRYLEDMIREKDRQLRIDMLSSIKTRGEMISRVMDNESLLSSTEEGAAFNAFYELLADSDRAAELNAQIHFILNHESSMKHLNPYQQKFLRKLLNELRRESDRIFTVRRRSEENLKNYMTSGAADDDESIGRLLRQVERVAIELGNQGLSGNHSLPSSLTPQFGSADVFILDRIKFHQVVSENTDSFEEEVSSNQLSANAIRALDTVQILHVAARIRDRLTSTGLNMTIKDLVRDMPLKAGLEELVAYVRVATAVRAIESIHENKPVLECIEFTEPSDGKKYNAELPQYILNAEMFPENLRELRF